MEWLNAMPAQKDNENITGTVRLTLSLAEWMMVREASVYHNCTMEEVIAHCINKSDALPEMSCDRS